jgi:hypothetical protein
MVSSVEKKALRLRRNKRRAYTQSKMSKGSSPPSIRRAGRSMTQEEAAARVKKENDRRQRANEARRQKRKE